MRAALLAILSCLPAQLCVWSTEAIQNLGWERSSFVISAKVFWGPGGGPNDVGEQRAGLLAA